MRCEEQLKEPPPFDFNIFSLALKKMPVGEKWIVSYPSFTTTPFFAWKMPFKRIPNNGVVKWLNDWLYMKTPFAKWESLRKLTTIYTKTVKGQKKRTISFSFLHKY